MAKSEQNPHLQLFLISFHFDIRAANRLKSFVEKSKKKNPA